MMKKFNLNNSVLYLYRYKDEYIYIGYEQEDNKNMLTNKQEKQLIKLQDYFNCDIALVLTMIKNGCYYRDHKTGKIQRSLNVNYNFKVRCFSVAHGKGISFYDYDELGTNLALTKEQLEDDND